MSEYVLKRDDGYWVADVQRNPSGGSYTRALQFAKRYPSKEAAEQDKCPGNETAHPL